ncbi:MAG TPA: NAD(P)/FAD-dependent oxidoreductase [Stellaceae bacterium]|nr:NAD(P)/FAD-dependent oxidoreductase [Stellaceae bacterium]
MPALEARLKQDFRWLELPAKPWVPARWVDGSRVRDAVIIGAGMCGLTAAAALKRLGVDNIVLYDRAPAGLEGPWASFARMETLRSPKQLTGPALSMPALTFRAWYEAQFGGTAWEALGKIPRIQWMEYLIWYRRVLDLPVRNDTIVTALRDHGRDIVAVDIDQAGVRQTVLTRRLVLATGRDGLGGSSVPAFARRLDRRFWAHSADDIDFAGLRGKRVGVVGAGASAMDNAATALEAGAASLDMFIRRTDIPRINKLTGIGSPGLVHGFQGLSDDWKWRFLDYSLSTQTPPPRDSTLRVSRHPAGRFHLGSPVLDIVPDGDAVRVTTPKGDYLLDFMIFATGFRTDLASRPELASVADHIRFWSDRFSPPEGLENGELAGSPDLGPDYAFQEKTPGACPVLARIHCFNYPASLSHGRLSGDIPAVSEGADRLARGIVRALFVEDRDQHFAALEAFATPELLGDEWTDADAP